MNLNYDVVKNAMPNLQIRIKAEAWQFALLQMTGIEPDIEYKADHARIYWTPAKLQQMQNWLDERMKAEPSGDVRIDFAQVVTPVLAKKAIPYGLGAIGAGILIGKII